MKCYPTIEQLVFEHIREIEGAPGCFGVLIGQKRTVFCVRVKGLKGDEVIGTWKLSNDSAIPYVEDPADWDGKIRRKWPKHWSFTIAPDESEIEIASSTGPLAGSGTKFLLVKQDGTYRLGPVQQVWVS